MSLDYVVTIMGIEQEFSISLIDIEVQQCHTVGDLHALTMRHVYEKRTGVNLVPGCHSNHFFYKIRRSLMEVLGKKRSEIRPSTSLDELFPIEYRRDKWTKFEKNAKIFLHQFHPFNGNDLVALVSGALSFFAILFTLILIAKGVERPLLTIALGITGAALAYFSSRYLNTWDVSFDTNTKTVGDIARLSGNTNFSSFVFDEEWAMESGKVFEKIQKIIVDQTGIMPEEVVPTATINELYPSG